jgi:hypothetical protein
MVSSWERVWFSEYNKYWISQDSENPNNWGLIQQRYVGGSQVGNAEPIFEYQPTIPTIPTIPEYAFGPATFGSIDPESTGISLLKDGIEVSKFDYHLNITQSGESISFWRRINNGLSTKMMDKNIGYEFEKTEGNIKITRRGDGAVVFEDCCGEDRDNEIIREIIEELIEEFIVEFLFKLFKGQGDKDLKDEFDAAVIETVGGSGGGGSAFSPNDDEIRKIFVVGCYAVIKWIYSLTPPILNVFGDRDLLRLPPNEGWNNLGVGQIELIAFSSISFQTYSSAYEAAEWLYCECEELGDEKLDFSQVLISNYNEPYTVIVARMFAESMRTQQERGFNMATCYENLISYAEHEAIEAAFNCSPPSTSTIAGFDLSRGGSASFELGSYFSEARASLIDNFPEVSLTSLSYLTNGDLLGINMVILCCLKSNTSYIEPLTESEQASLLHFVENGGCAMLLCDNSSASLANNSLIQIFGAEIDGKTSGKVIAEVIAQNEITNGPFGLIESFSQNWPGGLLNISNGLAIANNSLGVALAVINLGSGSVVIYSDSTFDVYFSDNENLFLNNINYGLGGNL